MTKAIYRSVRHQCYNLHHYNNSCRDMAHQGRRVLKLKPFSARRLPTVSSELLLLDWKVPNKTWVNGGFIYAKLGLELFKEGWPFVVLGFYLFLKHISESETSFVTIWIFQDVRCEVGERIHMGRLHDTVSSCHEWAVLHWQAGITKHRYWKYFGKKVKYFSLYVGNWV